MSKRTYEEYQKYESNNANAFILMLCAIISTYIFIYNISKKIGVYSWVNIGISKYGLNQYPKVENAAMAFIFIIIFLSVAFHDFKKNIIIDLENNKLKQSDLKLVYMKFVLKYIAGVILAVVFLPIILNFFK